MLFTHTHDDHTIGLGFFGLAYDPQARIELIASKEHLNSLKMHYCFRSKMFPVDLTRMPGVKEVKEFNGLIRWDGFEIETFKLNHPQGSYGFIINAEGKKIVIATDHEHEENLFEIGKKDKQFIEKVKGSDLILVDAQYTPLEYSPKQLNRDGLCRVGWGHSTDEKIIRMCLEAKIDLILLTHHDPNHSDKFLLERLNYLQELFKTRKIEYAKQGEVIVI